MTHLPHSKKERPSSRCVERVLPRINDGGILARLGDTVEVDARDGKLAIE
jgi:hypothetical protein